MARPTWNDQRAFSLLEIIAALGIVAIIFGMIYFMSRSLKSQNDVGETRLRMETIVAKAKAYYVQHGDLPAVEADGGIPLGADGLDIDAKYRFDGWQRPLRYVSHVNDQAEGRPGGFIIDPLTLYGGGPPQTGAPAIELALGTRTLLRAIEFEGRRVAGLIISLGPDQVEGYTRTPDTTTGVVTYILSNGSDDIILPIDLTKEATRIAQAELKVLNDKVAALEDRYLAIDNDGDNEYDEAGCDAIPYLSDIPDSIRTVANCSVVPFIAEPGDPPPATELDINCGKPTLDHMKAAFCPPPFGAAAGCPPGYYRPRRGTVVIRANDPGPPPTTVVCQIIPARPAGPAAYGTCYWGLVETQDGTPDPAINETRGDQARAYTRCLFNLRPEDVVDPWLNGYIWGCGVGSGCTNTYPVNDPHYHRFFSAGPDGVPTAVAAGSDDIVN